MEKIITSPADPSVVLFVGLQEINWISEDCGENIRDFTLGEKSIDFVFHPTERNWLLASIGHNCASQNDGSCLSSNELFVSIDLGKSWNQALKYVFDYDW